MIVNRIRFFRWNWELTQEDLANRLGVSVNTVSSWESGFSYPNLFHIFMLMHLFKVNFNDIFVFVEEK